MANYEYLFKPLPVGHKVFKNRIIFGPHVTNFWPNQLPDERTTAYYEERAAAGVGAIIIGASPVDQTGNHAPFMTCKMWSDECIPGLHDIAVAVQRHGAKLLIQLTHTGVHRTPGDDPYPLIAPSQVPAEEEPFHIPREATVEDLHAIADKFADAAERAQRAGLDGIEFHGGHGYLLWAFVTPTMNKRTDQYGGSLENRVRFYLEVIDKVRRRVGKDFIVGCRISSSDMVPGAVEIEEGAEIARMLEATGQVDYIHCSLGLYRSVHFTVASHYSGLEPGFEAPLTATIKAAVKNIPVFVVGRINDPILADKLISDGTADACVLIRELIAEPEFALKAQQGHIDDIRPCAYWNQGCIGRIWVGQRLQCMMNHASGHETEFGKDHIHPAAKPKHILVVGGGPAGLEFARIAAKRGHRITIYERGSELGGQINMFARLPGRAEVRNWLDWLVRQVQKAGVDIHLNSEVDATNIQALISGSSVDEIVVASGAHAAADGRSGVTTEPIPGYDQPHVLTYEHVLAGELPKTLGSRVLIVDELADRIAPGIAEMLADKSRTIEILTRWPSVGHDSLGPMMELPWIYEKLDSLGIKKTSDSWVKSIDKGAVSAFNIYSGRAWQIEVDTVILVTTKYSNTAIERLIRERTKLSVHVIGDVVAPRLVGDAISDATRLAHTL
ncbi:putative NADH oxidase [Georgfuchsia toluolica]|uniref:NADH oxidase n=2 Tax=Georgfuchsia toluolica TaxID=424218 RepID=A0A916J7V3_9PROT|nr:putative NADH oxidase [Georgfuchsia toluolica]